MLVEKGKRKIQKEKKKIKKLTLKD